MPDGRGLFLDLDGTLADSLSVMRTAYDRFLAHCGACGSDAGFAAVDGPPLAGVVASLKRTHGLAASTEELTGVYMGFIVEAYDRVEPRPGAAALIDRARRAGWRTAVVTSSREALVRRWLARAGLEDAIDAVVGAESVTRGKPDPEPYRVALVRAGCGARASVAVEDSPRGAAAAVAAGMRTFVLASPLHGPDAYPAGVRPVTGFAQVEKALFDA